MTPLNLDLQVKKEVPWIHELTFLSWWLLYTHKIKRIKSLSGSALHPPFCALCPLLASATIRGHTLKVLCCSGHWKKTSYKLNVLCPRNVIFDGQKCYLGKVTNNKKSDKSDSLVGRTLWSRAVPIVYYYLCWHTYFIYFLPILTSTTTEVKLHLV